MYTGPHNTFLVNKGNVLELRLNHSTKDTNLEKLAYLFWTSNLAIEYKL
jgi:hypothetical protein